jgi:hypothetical protein
VKPEPDPSLEELLDLDGQVLVVDPAGRYWVKFTAHRVPVTRERPHGIDYSCTLHGPGGERVFGIDNAHMHRQVRRRDATRDHRHRERTIRSYAYSDALTLIADFWKEVDAILRELGIFTS